MRMTARGLVFAMLWAACAIGGSNVDHQKLDGSVGDHKDAQRVTSDGSAHNDAPQQSDAASPIDAPQQQIDGGGGGGVCSNNTQCTTAGQCCFVALCVPGTAVGVNICLPM